MKNKNFIVVYSTGTYQRVIQMFLVNLTAYWILSRMLIVIYYVEIMQFLIFFKTSPYPFYKINPSHKTTVSEINFLTNHNRFFTKIYFLQYFRK